MCYVLKCDCGAYNYLDPYYFWNWEGKVKCAGCDKVYKMKFINGKAIEGPTLVDEPYDVMPLLADFPDKGYYFEYPSKNPYVKPGTEGRTRPYNCLMRDPATYTGTATMCKKSLRGKFVRAWGPQPKKHGLADSRRFAWFSRTKGEEVWMKEEYPGKPVYGKFKAGEVPEEEHVEE